jgi:imidazolonepropionase-like amidohydrolase
MTSKVLHNFTLIDGTGRFPVADAALVLEDERIRGVGPRDELTLPTEGANWQDLGGCWVLPGLIDCHVHLAMAGSPTSCLEGEWGYTAALMLRHARASLEAGFTALRDVGGRHHLEFGIRRALQEGLWSGPRLFLAGKVLSMTAAGAEYFDGMYREADGPNEVRKAAREQLKVGADFIKLMASGAVLTPGEEPGAPQYGVGEMQVAVEEAEKVSRPVAAHAHGSRAIRNAVEAGVRTIEHGTYLKEDPELIDRMAEEGVVLVPTLKSLHDLLAHEQEGIPRWAVEKGRRNQEILARSVQQAREQGVVIAMGTDAGTPYNYHGENGLELALMAEAGLTPMEAIVAATRNGALAMGQEDKMGTVEPGKLADLLVVRGDPLADLRILTQRENIEAVFVGGQQVVH